MSRHKSCADYYIMRKIKNVLRALRPNRNVHYYHSYSQEGEDMMLRELLGDRQDGFYVDIGAYDPENFSNTNYFYRKGWHGINIEPSPEAFSRFEDSRKRDLNLNMGISDKRNSLTYYVYSEPALNTFDQQRVTFLKDRTGREPLKSLRINVDTIASVLGDISPEPAIDFMNIDVEGYEMQVLRSNDWKKYRPKIILVEILDFDLRTILQNPIHIFMEQAGYDFRCKTPRTSFYSDASVT